MYGVDSGVLANVIRHVLAHTDHGVAGAYAGGLGFAGEGAVGSEGDGERGARQVDDSGFGVAERYFEEELRRVVGGGQDDVGREGLGLCGEVGAEVALVTTWTWTPARSKITTPSVEIAV